MILQFWLRCLKQNVVREVLQDAERFLSREISETRLKISLRLKVIRQKRYKWFNVNAEIVYILYVLQKISSVQILN